MKKWLKILFSLNSLIKQLGYQSFFKAAQNNYHLEVIGSEEFSTQYKKALVLAPHADDDCFGCGGAIAQIAKSDGKVKVIYYFSGEGGVKKVGGTPDKSLIEIRRQEAKAAGQILGIEDQRFLNFPDGKLADSSAAIKYTKDLIKEFQPDIIFLPSFLDNHSDHLAVNSILIKTLKALSKEKSQYRANFQIWSFEVWTPLFTNRIVSINNVVDLKKQALAAQKSQLEARRYDKAILGLNQYRAEINAQEGFAEAYFAVDPATYVKMYQRRV